MKGKNPQTKSIHNTTQATKFSTSLLTQISFGNDSLHNNLSFNWVQILSPNKINLFLWLRKSITMAGTLLKANFNTYFKYLWWL